MKNNCFLSFRSRNLTDNVEVKIAALAHYEYSEKKQSVTFEEEEGEFKNCLTTVTVEDGRRVSISRDGRYSTYIVCEKNKRSISQHVTPFGSYSLGMTLKEFSSELDENGGRLSFSYTTDSDMRIVSHIEFDIKIKVKSGILD